MSLFWLNLVPFLARGLRWRCFWGGRDFSGSIFNFLPFLCEKCPFLRYLCCLEKLINSFRKTESFLQEIGTGLNCVPNLHSLRKCHEQFYCNFLCFAKKLLFSLQPNDLGLEVPNWCIQWCTQILNSLMHSLMHPGPCCCLVQNSFRDCVLYFGLCQTIKLDDIEVAISQ